MERYHRQIGKEAVAAIAIIGIGCRFPGGISDAASFWDFVLKKGDAVTDIPADRWDVDKYYDPDPEAPGRMYTRRGSFLTNSFTSFDHDFFGISRREAAILDPQQRQLLEVAWEALDDAGIAGRVAGDAVGTFIGGFTNDNAVGRARAHSLENISNFAATSSSQTLLSNRLAYALDLRGPSLTVDTACSSSLVATHLAVRAISDGDCDVALVGGANVMFQPETFITMCKGRFLSFDGRCKSFDAAADGYGRGEGIGVTVLKNLDQALRDRDAIYAVIRGSGVNQDGRTLALPVPNPDSQQTLSEKVCAESGIEPAQVGYVEAHGTGTGVGDPLELMALGKAYGAATGRNTWLRIGSVKNNFGHTEAAAGVAGLIKAALTVKEGTIAPQAYLHNPNPEIPFDDLRIMIPTEAERLSGTHAAVNSFGYGGTNAHVVVERPPAPPLAPAARDSIRIFPVSARSGEALHTLARRYADTIRSMNSGEDIQDLKTAVTARRAHHYLRKAFVYSDVDDLRHQLGDFADSAEKDPLRTLVEGVTDPVFVFSGMGPQWWAMGRSLLQAPGRFRDTALKIDHEFHQLARWSVLDELLRDKDSSHIGQTEKAQPANFLIQVALVEHLSQFGIVPAAVMGHSVGEIAAAYVCGALSLTDALTIAFHRSRLQATTAGSGGMLAVGLSSDEAGRRIARFDGRICVAAVNGSAAVTLAGDAGALDTLHGELTGEGIFARRLNVEVPYHSHLMDPILKDLGRALAGLTSRQSTIPVYSTVTGKQIAGADFGSAEYWQQNVRETVRFADAVAALIEDRYRVFLEIGPHPVLVGNIRASLVHQGVSGAAIASLTRDHDAETAILTAVAELYTAGAINTPGDTTAYTDTPVPHCDLPKYPWAKTQSWEEDPRTLRDRYGDPDRFALLGDRTGSLEPEWEVTLSRVNLPWLHDHCVGGAVVLPGAAYIDAALSAARQRTGRDQCGLDAVSFTAPLVIAEHDVPIVRVAVEESTKRFTVKGRSAHSDLWTIHSRGRLIEARTGELTITVPREDPSDTVFVRDDIYGAMAAIGLNYGRAFQRIETARISGTTCVAQLRTTSLADDGYIPNAPDVVHPATVDAALQCAAVLLATRWEMGRSGAVAQVPVSVDRVRLHTAVPDDPLAIVTITHTSPLRVDAYLTAPDGTVALALHGVEFSPVGGIPDPLADLDRYFYEHRWLQLPAAEPGPPPQLGQAQPLNAVFEVADAPVAVTKGLLGAARSDPLHFTGGLGDPEGRAAIADALVAVLARDGYLRIGIAAGQGYSAPTMVFQIVSLAQVVSAVINRESDPTTAIPDVRIVVVTRNAHVTPGDRDVDLSHAALIGARRTLANEHSPVQWYLLDTDQSVTAHELTSELVTGATPESDEIALRRGGARMVDQLVRSCADITGKWEIPYQTATPDTAYEVQLPRTRLLKDLALRACDRPEPQARQVEVRVDSIGLNYKDALKVLGILTGRQLSGTYFGASPGMEAVGVVSRVGSDTGAIRVGDTMTIAVRDLLRRYVTVNLDGGGAWVHVPQTELTTGGIDLDPLTIGSGLPFLTSIYALRTLARLQPGESVLVHGAAGGMGMAAVQVAASMGATVYATATDERRQTVSALGATRVLDSRSTGFVDEIRRLTSGKGVDVIFNSLPGEIISQNFAAAAEFGRIIEIGKADIYFGGAIDLRPFARNLAFYSIDMDRLLEHQPARFSELMRESAELLSTGRYSALPLHPVSHHGTIRRVRNSRARLPYRPRRRRPPHRCARRAPEKTRTVAYQPRQLLPHHRWIRCIRAGYRAGSGTARRNTHSPRGPPRCNHRRGAEPDRRTRRRGRHHSRRDRRHQRSQASQ